MTDRSLEDVVADLDDLLETERAALLSGDLEIIGRQLHRKENLVDELSVLDAADTRALAAVAGKLRRNQDLLDYALDGIRSVATRLAALRRVKEALDTYDATGTRKSVKISKESSLEKRA